MALFPELERGPTWSEEWRAECEARMVASLPRWQRREYFERIANRRGEDSARALAAVYRRIMAG